MTDFSIINIPYLLAVPVRTSDEFGNEVPDDGEWHRSVTSSQFVFAEFLVARGLILGISEITRSPDLIVMWSQLTPMGQLFAKAHYHKWLTSVGKTGLSEADKLKRLERRWRLFNTVPDATRRH